MTRANLPLAKIAPAMTLLVALLSACSAERAPADASTAQPTPEAADPAPDQPTQDVPPATAPDAADPAPDPATSTPNGDGDMARFDGYGDLKFGIAAADMAGAWGGELKEVGKDANDACYFMTPKWVKTPAEFNFMVEGGKFVRFGTESEKFVAPGGGKVGMTKAEIATLYAGRVEEQPHKYSDGQYLRIKDSAGGAGVLVFETDAKADTAKVSEWRVGLPPQVDYVEGCS